MVFVSELNQSMNRVGRFRYTATALFALAGLCLVSLSQAVEQPDVRWGQIQKELLGERVVLDGADVIELDTPVRALDAAVVPVTVKAKIEQTPEEITTQIPHLTLAQVHAALAYYHANRDEMDAAIAAEEAEADRLEQQHRESRKNR